MRAVCTDAGTDPASLRAYGRAREGGWEGGVDEQGRSYVVRCVDSYKPSIERRKAVAAELKAMGVVKKEREAIRKRMVVHDRRRLLGKLVRMIGGW